MIACVEVMDCQRFGKRKKVGRLPAPAGAALRAKAPPFGNLAPLDLSAAPRAKTAPAVMAKFLGHIDRQGNRRLRSLLTEAVWRLLRWEPRWQAFAN